VNELERIQDQIVRSLDGAAWHGPALMEVLSGVDVQAAVARPIPNAHTIWEIVRHVSASTELVLFRLRGDARTLSPEEDWPAPPSAGDLGAWNADIRHLAEVHRELIAELSTIDAYASRLDAPIVPGFSSVYVTLHGLVQHDLYHAGQIALIKKAL
jgi:uncharacterized damage-inducible protein DinB